MDGPPKDQALTELLDDAILVASFGQRSGRFEDNSLFAAIRAAKAQEDLGWGSQEVADLQEALNKAVRMIQPVTLIDLKSGWNPFRKPKEGGRSRSSRVAVLFICAASFLILACGYYTVWYKRAGSLLESIAEAKDEKQTAIINDVISAMIGAEGGIVFGRGINPGDITHESIREKIELARKIDKKIELDQASYYEATLNFIPTTNVYYGLRSWLYPVGANLIGEAQAAEALAAEAQAAMPAAQNWRPVGCTPIEPPPASTPSAPGAPADPSARHRAAISDFNRYVADDDQLVAQVRCAIGIVGTNYAGVFANPEKVKRDISEKMDLLGTWLLPALYGALGALMFHMRAFLDPLQPNPSPARVLLRVSLGIFAGISVAWFLTPTVADGINSVGLGVLTIAFLLGFSIDVFFALLDRLVTLARNGIANLGGA